MNLTCPKCSKLITVSEAKLPQNQEKAMIKCPACQQIIVFLVPKNTNPQQPENKSDEPKTLVDNIITKQNTNKTVQLIEIASQKIFPLKIGKNIIGRNADISINNGDKFMSRKHCLIEITNKNNTLNIILTDNGEVDDNAKPSTNGTFYNGSPERLSVYDKIYLNNGDKIKIGHTDFYIAIK